MAFYFVWYLTEDEWRIYASLNYATIDLDNDLSPNN